MGSIKVWVYHMEKNENVYSSSSLNNSQILYGNNANILYLIKQKMKKDPELALLVNLFVSEDNDEVRMNLIEDILICFTDAKIVENGSKGKYINAGHLYVLEVLDNLSVFPFSKQRNGNVFSEIELADTIEREFENLKLELYTKFMQQLYGKRNFFYNDDNKMSDIFSSVIQNETSQV